MKTRHGQKYAEKNIGDACLVRFLTTADARIAAPWNQQNNYCNHKDLKDPVTIFRSLKTRCFTHALAIQIFFDKKK
jgi:hypothetical protein